METEGKLHQVSSEWEKDKLLMNMCRLASKFTFDFSSMIRAISEKTNARLWGLRYDTIQGEVTAAAVFELPPRGIVALTASGYDRIKESSVRLFVSPFFSPQEQECEELIKAMWAREKKIDVGLPSTQYQEVPLVYDNRRYTPYAPWVIASFDEQTSFARAVASYIKVACRYTSLKSKPQSRFAGLDYEQQDKQQFGSFLVLGYIPWVTTKRAIVEDVGEKLIRLSRYERPVWEHKEVGGRWTILAAYDEFFKIFLTNAEEIYPERSDYYLVPVFTPDFYVVWKHGQWCLMGNCFYVIQTSLDVRDYLQQHTKEILAAYCKLSGGEGSGCVASRLELE